MIRRLVRFASFLCLMAIAAAIAGIAAFARPQPFFAHSRNLGPVTIHATHPIPPTADAVLADISSRLNASPLGPAEGPFNLFVAGEGWRWKVYFGLAPYAGGLVFYPVSGNGGFLAGADFDQGRLIKHGRTIGPPRTLAYYGTHELTHVLVGQRVGAIRFHTMPDWVREGLADYVALGPVDIAAIDALLGDRPVTRADMDRHGVYIRKRMLVTWALDHAGWGLDRLLASDLTDAEALAAMRREQEAS